VVRDVRREMAGLREGERGDMEMNARASVWKVTRACWNETSLGESWEGGERKSESVGHLKNTKQPQTGKLK